MRINPILQRGIRGFALIITMVFLVVALLIFGSIYSWTSSNAIVTLRNNQYNMSQNAAESAVERVIGQIDRDFILSGIGDASTYTGLPAVMDQSGWPIQYTFSDTNGNRNVVSVCISGASSDLLDLNSQYSGLYGMGQTIDVSATATPIGQPYNVPASVHESLQFACIPLYQFAIFYNINLEIDPGAAMTISGRVFSNQSIWEGSSVCTFSSTVSAVGTNCTKVSNPFGLNYTGSGASTFSLAGQPVDHCNALTMPIGKDNSPASVMALLNLPPPDYAMGTPAAYSSVGQTYPANAADLVITNCASGTNDGLLTPFGTNYIVYFQDSSLQPLPYDYYIMTNRVTHAVYSTNFVADTFVTNIVYAGFSWITNSVFYDWREGWSTNSSRGKRVEAVQIDVDKLHKWLVNTNAVNSGYVRDQAKFLHTGHHIDSVYVYTSVPLTVSQLPAVRMINGSQMPTPGGSKAGFTVATPFPMYVLGNYNSQSLTGSSLGLNTTSNTYPAALMADSITILSTSWNDSVTNKLPTPGNTTVNAAMLEGIVQTDPTISGDYSGGVENFMRLLENWGGTLTYNGSIVVLFYSQYATNHWRPTGNYYNAPTRKWAFDLNFKRQSGLPPLTPQAKAMVRGNWYALK